MLRLTATLGNPLRLIGSGFIFGERLIAAERGGESSVLRRRLADHRNPEAEPIRRSASRSRAVRRCISGKDPDRLSGFVV